MRPGHRGAYAGCVVRRQPGTADATVGGTEDLDEPAQAAEPGADCVRSMVPWCGGSQLASWAESPWGTDVIVAAPGLSLSLQAQRVHSVLARVRNSAQWGPGDYLRRNRKRRVYLQTKDLK